jgi:hypothetical protein
MHGARQPRSWVIALDWETTSQVEPYRSRCQELSIDFPSDCMQSISQERHVFPLKEVLLIWAVSHCCCCCCCCCWYRADVQVVKPVVWHDLHHGLAEPKKRYWSRLSLLTGLTYFRLTGGGCIISSKWKSKTCQNKFWIFRRSRMTLTDLILSFMLRTSTPNDKLIQLRSQTNRSNYPPQVTWLSPAIIVVEELFFCLWRHHFHLDRVYVGRWTDENQWKWLKARITLITVILIPVKKLPTKCDTNLHLSSKFFSALAERPSTATLKRRQLIKRMSGEQTQTVLSSHLTHHESSCHLFCHQLSCLSTRWTPHFFCNCVLATDWSVVTWHKRLTLGISGSLSRSL